MKRMTLCGLVVVALCLVSGTAQAFQVALAYLTVFDGRTNVADCNVVLTKEGGSPVTIKPVDGTYYMWTETTPKYTLDIALKDGRKTSVTGTVGARNFCIALKCTFEGFAPRIQTERAGNSVFVKGKLQLTDKKTGKNYAGVALIDFKRTDAEGAFQARTDANGYIETAFTKPSTWDITVAPWERSVKSQVLKAKFIPTDTEQGLRLPCDVVSTTAGAAADGGM